MGMSDHVFDSLDELQREAYERGVRDEREACAKLCEDNCADSYGRETQGPCLTEFPKDGGGRHDGMTYAAAIRARSNAKVTGAAPEKGLSE